MRPKWNSTACVARSGTGYLYTLLKKLLLMRRVLMSSQCEKRL